MQRVKFYHKETGTLAVVRCCSSLKWGRRHHLPTVREAEDSMLRAGYTRPRPREKR